MFKSHLRLLSILLLGFSLAGCSSGPVEEKITVPTTNIEANAKKMLEEFAKSGQLGSGITSLESDINAIKTTDAAKGAALQEGFLKLQAAASPDKVKEAAKEMLSKF